MFYIQLDSRRAENFNRLLGVIKFRFPNTIYFPGSDWVVSLTEFSIPSVQNSSEEVVYITTDAVEMQLTSSTYSRLLKVAPTGSRYQETRNQRLCRLDVNELSGIEIRFTTADNQPIAIRDGNVILSLLFQRLV